MIAMFAWPYVVATALVAPENDGPTTPRTVWSWITEAAAVGACAGSPWSSAFTSLSLKPRSLDLLAWSMATWTALTSLMPSCWLSPDSGPSKAMEYVAPPPEPPRPPELDLDELLELLLFPHAARASEAVSTKGTAQVMVRVFRMCLRPPASPASA